MLRAGSCSREEIGLAAEKIDGWCGKERSESADIEAWRLTYGQTRKHQNICPKFKLRGGGSSTWWFQDKSGGLKVWMIRYLVSLSAVNYSRSIDMTVIYACTDIGR